MRWIAATDGSALGNPGPGGWAWAISKTDALVVTDWNSGSFAHTTNNIAELQALIDLLEFTPTAQPLEIRIDSQYTLNAASKWRHGWKKRGWKKADGKPVANVDLMMKLDELLEGRDIEYVWVRAHQKDGDPLNDFVDRKAQAAAREQRGW